MRFRRMACLIPMSIGRSRGLQFGIVYGSASATSLRRARRGAQEVLDAGRQLRMTLPPLSGLATSSLAVFEMPLKHGYPSSGQTERGQGQPRIALRSET